MMQQNYKQTYKNTAQSTLKSQSYKSQTNQSYKPNPLKQQKQQLKNVVHLKEIHEFFPLEKTYYRDKLNLTQENKVPRYSKDNKLIYLFIIDFPI